MAKRRKSAKKSSGKMPMRKRKSTRTVAKRKKTAKKTSMMKRAKRRVKRAVSVMMP